MWLKPPDDISLLLNKRARLENMYYITDKNGREIPFNLNWAQIELNDNRWHQMLILKARQLGCTTFWAIDFLDDCFWMDNLSAGIIAHRKEDAENIFKKKVRFAYDRMPKWTREINEATNDRSTELAFRNGSSYRVSTGFRSGTNQRLLISEFGKICASAPDVAKEIVTGSLNTVEKDQIIVIESTAEGREGYFWQFSQEAEKLAQQGVKLSQMQMRFFFFPWFKEDTYREKSPQVIVSKETNEYLDRIEVEVGRRIDEEQRRWYEMKQRLLSNGIKQEFPSTPKEAFESANEGLYYGSQISKLRANGHICRVPYSEYSLVHTAWDIGLDDFTSIIVFQLSKSGEVQIIDFKEDYDEAPTYYVDWLKSRNYRFGTHIFPHDAKQRDILQKTSYVDFVKPLIDGRFVILDIKECNKLIGIQQVRSILSKSVFDEQKCQKLVKHLESYRKIWDDRLGCYKSEPFHDEHSHAADAMRYLACGIRHVEGASRGSVDNDLKAIRNYYGM